MKRLPVKRKRPWEFSAHVEPGFTERECRTTRWTDADPAAFPPFLLQLKKKAGGRQL